MRWRSSGQWLVSDTGHQLCKSNMGRYAAWRGTKFLGFTGTKGLAAKLCEEDDAKRRR